MPFTGSCALGRLLPIKGAGACPTPTVACSVLLPQLSTRPDSSFHAVVVVLVHSATLRLAFAAYVAYVAFVASRLDSLRADKPRKRLQPHRTPPIANRAHGRIPAEPPVGAP